MTDPSAWWHCLSKEKPADSLTRGLSCKDLIKSERRWHGSEWLNFPENDWPQINELNTTKLTKKLNLTVNQRLSLAQLLFVRKIIDLDSFRNLRKLLRVTAWILPFVQILKRNCIEKDPLISEEINSLE